MENSSELLTKTFEGVSPERMEQLTTLVAKEISRDYQDAFVGNAARRGFEPCLRDFSSLVDDFVSAAIDGDADVLKSETLTESDLAWVTTLGENAKVLILNTFRDLGKSTERSDYLKDLIYKSSAFSQALVEQLLYRDIAPENVSCLWRSLGAIEDCFRSDLPGDNIERNLCQNGIIAEVVTARAFLRAGFTIQTTDPTLDVDHQVDIIATRHGQRIYIQCKGDYRATGTEVEIIDPQTSYKGRFARLVEKAKADGAFLAVPVTIGLQNTCIDLETGQISSQGLSDSITGRVLQRMEPLERRETYGKGYASRMPRTASAT